MSAEQNDTVPGSSEERAHNPAEREPERTVSTADRSGVADRARPPEPAPEHAPEPATASSETGSSAGESPNGAEPAAADAPPAVAREEGAGGESAESEGEGGEEEGEGDAEGASAEGGAPGEGQKRKRRRRRRKKGPGQEVTSAGGTPAEGGEATAGEPGAAHGERARQEGRHDDRRKELHLPFQRFFGEGHARTERRHAFSVGEIVAGRVQKIEHGASVIDLFGKALAYALENEPRDVPMPLPGQPEPHEVEDEGDATAHAHAEEAAHGDAPAQAGSPHAVDPSQVGGAAARFEGAVGMPGSESLPAAAPADVSSADGGTTVVEMGPGPDGILGTDDDEPLTGDADPYRVGKAARALRGVGTPTSEPPDDDDPAGEPTEAVASRESSAGGTSTAGGIDAPDEAPAEEARPEDPLLEVGTIFRGRVAAVAESGHIAIHNKLVTRADARLKLAKAREEHRRVWGIVYGFNRGGFDVLVEGVRAFCPVSGMTAEHVEEPETLLGRRLEFSVQQAKSGHQGIVVSRRSILEKEARKRAKELRRSLQPGQKLKGRVTQVREFGLFVDIGGVEGLVHLSELSWDRTARPGDVAKPGDEVEVQVLRVTEPQGRKDRDGRIALSMKSLALDPWDEQLQGIEEGSVRKGKITRTAEFGAFVEVATGVEGLLHVTELGANLRHANEKVKEGDEIYVVLERIDKRARRISLSRLSDKDAKAYQEGQLETGKGGKVIRPGALLKVKVERVEPHGLHVQVEGVLGRRGRGFIPNAEMGTERGTDHRKKFGAGTEIDVKVIGTDRDGGLRLSRKAFSQDEERRAVQDYRKEAATKGFGTFGDLLKSKLGKR
jgi:small subunit ribosomal protein S1